MNYAEQYFRALSQAFPYVLNFGALYNSPNNATYKPVDAKTIKIPSVSTTGRKDGDRDTIGSFSRNHTNDWETKTLTNHRDWETLIHPVDVIQTNMVATIQNATKVFNEEQKFPEMDAYLVSKIYNDYVELGKTADTTPLTETNILSIFDKLMKEMDNARVPQTGRILYVTPDVKYILKEAQGIQRNISVEGGEKVINRNISRLDEVQIVSVPSELMKTAYNFTQGWTPSATSKQINMFLVHPIAVLTPSIYSFASIDEPTAKTKGKYLYFEEAFEDVFIMNKKVDAIKFNVEV